MDHGMGKWPYLLVTGKDVTPEQAAEVIVATTHWTLKLRPEDEWSREVAARMGVGWDSYRMLDRDGLDRFYEGTGVEYIEYLANRSVHLDDEEADSSWIGWDGSVGTSGMTLAAKWPSHTEIHYEWGILARRFPFLDLTAQLIRPDWGNDEEYLSEPRAGELLGTWRVRGGELVLWEGPSGSRIRELKVPTVDEHIAAMQAAHGTPATDVSLIGSAINRLKKRKT